MKKRYYQVYSNKTMAYDFLEMDFKFNLTSQNRLLM